MIQQFRWHITGRPIVKSNPVFDNPGVNRLARKANEEATRELASKPRDQLDPGNPNHPRFDKTGPVLAKDLGKPVSKDIFFADAPDIGHLWRQLWELENQLADRLLEHPLGAAAIVDGDAWMLRDDGENLYLVHGNWDGSTLTDETSRFDFDLGWIDIDEDGLHHAISMVQQAIDQLDQDESGLRLIA